MTTEESPRKPLAGSDEDLSVEQLSSIPLKKRLEILFASNIIPSRRQLALKYELSERLIHNVLSHRKYLLENWKYNADAKSLLSKLALENAMAMTELLIEWKRRVELNGLQITPAALTRKADYLQRVLNGSSDILPDKWWDQFDINWMYKQFQDYEDDSLEIEDILNDLQWMFSESTFRRLVSGFRQAKNGGRILGAAKRAEMSTLKNEEFDDFEEYFEISDIKAEPHYYNDDDFECEDYEFVLDEEVVIDALRKELEDSEQAKYQQYLLGDISNESVSQEAQKLTDSLAEEEEEEDNNVNDNDNDVSYDFVDDEILEKMSSTSQTEISKTKDISNKIDIKHEESPNIIQIEAPTSNNPVTLRTHTAPKRKPRNLNAVLSLRKDYVRMPAVTEIAHLARKQCLEQLLKDSDEYDEDLDLNSKEQQKRRKRKKAASPKIKSAQRKTYKPRARDVMLNSNATRSSPDDLTSDLIEIQNNHAHLQLDFETYAATSKHSYSYDSFDEPKQEIPSPIASDDEEYIVETKQITETKTKTTAVANSADHEAHYEQNNNNADKLGKSQPNIATKTLNASARRSNKITAKAKLSHDLDDENILSEAFSYDEIINSKVKNEMDIEEEITGTAIQTKDNEEESNQPNDAKKRRISNTRTYLKSGNKKPIRLAKSPLKPENPTPNPSKRAKRRTDGSDLTLRKDKVRLNLVRLVREEVAAENSPSDCANIDADVQMVFEPYMGE